ncbi:solute carrier family 28 member 3-like [Liolophura sinensis]|uniref:solute carrier family 28 member 3-like n=1 Tax=Liolophura sinensis TaxID=3198878 RepID=UPI00315882E8
MQRKEKYEITDSPPDSTSHSKENNDDVYEEKKDGVINPGYSSSNETIGSSHFEIEPVTNGHPQNLSTGNAANRSGYSRTVQIIQTSVRNFYDRHEDPFWMAFKVVLAILYFIYFGFALAYSFGDEGSIRLLVVTILVTVFIITRIVCGLCGDGCMLPYRRIKNMVKSMSPSQKKKYARFMTWFYIFFMIGYFAFIVIWVIVDVGLKNPENLLSAAGVAIFILLFYIFSYNPAAVTWRPVLWGMYIQFAFALLILRWEVGFQAFKWLGDRIQEFLAHTDAGAIFVFGDSYMNHFFAFKVLPVIVFFSTMMSILYYWGVMQFVIRHIARVLAFALGTSPAESLNAAGNIFIGQTEAPLMIRPFLKKLTNSELHAVMTGGFATIAGSVMAAYISYGVPANHLIAASVMSAPAALAMSKLFYPQIEEVQADGDDVYNMAESEHSNVLAAASEGASTSIGLVANIAANLIAFIAILAFVNATLKWFGHRIGMYNPELTFEWICSYVFWPVPFFMGVHVEDCRRVAELIGVKTFLNEFVAYTRLAVFLENRKTLVEYNDLGWDNVTCTHINNGDIYLNATNVTLVGGVMTDRSEVITTYALCGFSNIGSIGIMIGGLGALAPERKTDITKTVVRAMIAGNVACFLTACIAGLLYQPPIDPLAGNITCGNDFIYQQ